MPARSDSSAIRRALVGALLFAACRSDAPAVAASEETATPAPTSTDADTPDESTGATEPPPAECTAPIVGEAPLRRMSAVQYANTLRDLFGGVVPPSVAFPATIQGELYTNDLDANPVSQLGVEQIMDAAEAVALAAGEHHAELGVCAGAALEHDCTRAWLELFAARAWRRPLADDERSSLLGLFDSRAALGDATDGLVATITAILQSPSFLYFVEAGSARDVLPADIVAVSDHELATRLSYLIWDTMPDAALFAAAEAGALATADGLAEHTERMLDDRARSAPALARFYVEWLGVVPLRAADKDPLAFPELDDALAAAIDRELASFVEGVVLGDDPRLATLFTSARTRIDTSLAAFFGVDRPADGWVELDPGQRGGLLARPAVAARHAARDTTSPTHRGLLVRSRMLCESIPPPPPGAMQMVPELPPDATTRERSAALVESSSCGGCHALMDPIGLGFEHYDALGRWRDVDDDGRTIDASGELVGGAGPFDGVAELQALLAEDDAVRDCFVQHWVRHVYGLAPGELDGCVVAELRDAFAASGDDLRELVVLTTTSDAFRFRRAEAP